MTAKFRVGQVVRISRRCPDFIREKTLSKFKVGDKVILTKRCPDFIKRSCRFNRVRTIISAFYEPDKQCCYYLLGSNGMGNDYVSAYYFRSYMLSQPLERAVGRPSHKKRRKKTGNNAFPIMEGHAVSHGFQGLAVQFTH